MRSFASLVLAFIIAAFFALTPESAEARGRRGHHKKGNAVVIVVKGHNHGHHNKHHYHSGYRGKSHKHYHGRKHHGHKHYGHKHFNGHRHTKYCRH